MSIHGIFPTPHTKFDDDNIIAKQSLGSILSVSIEIYFQKFDVTFSLANENAKKQSGKVSLRCFNNEVSKTSAISQ